MPTIIPTHMRGIASSYAPYQRALIDSGSCIGCRNPRGEDGTTRMCRKCADKANERSWRYIIRSNRTIADCSCGRGKYHDNGRLNRCIICRREEGSAKQRVKAAIKKRIEDGICSDCAEPRVGKRFCEQHTLRQIIYNHELDCTFEQLAAMLQAQGNLCYYTGRPISIGTTAQLEHKKPVGRFPDLAKSLDNIVFSHVDANMNKGSKTDDEFFAMCLEVVRHRGLC